MIKMEKTILILVAIVISIATNNAQTLQSVFDKYSNDERFEYVSVGRGLISMAGLFGGMAKDEKVMMAKMKNVKILTLESAVDTPIMKTFIQEVQKLLENGNFETAIEVRDKTERVNIYYRVTGKDNADLLIVTKDKGEYNLIWISGKMTKSEMMDSFTNNNFKVECVIS